MKFLQRQIGDAGEHVSKPSASRFMFSRVSATRLRGLNIGRRVAAVVDLGTPALMAVIRRHEPICGALRRLAGTIIDKARGLADERLLLFSAHESEALPE